MDIVTDLASQAISFLTLLQDISKDKNILTRGLDDSEYMPAVRQELAFFRQHVADIGLSAKPDDDEKYTLDAKRINRIKEILFCSLPLADVEQALLTAFFDITGKLLDWLDKWRLEDEAVFSQNLFGNTPILLMAPDEWRRNIRHILYNKPEERLILAKIIHYMPALVISALGEKNKELQRIYQVFNDGKPDLLLSGKHNEDALKWWSGVPAGPQGWTISAYFEKRNVVEEPDSDVIAIAETSSLTGTRLEVGAILLSDDSELFDWVVQENPVSFDMTFNRELDLIVKTREKREQDPGSEKAERLYSGSSDSNGSDLPHHFRQSATPPGHTKDPLKRAEEMQLTALAFSGGGIRSATFNLGVIQKLAEKGILHHIDYLSTVSGGGYIGSWLLSWIYRSGSISKVTSRLDTRKSSDPMADEVHPLRWLRMYSNYLSPNASIMSTDAWTIGITWIRNTLINQSILLILLCAVLSAIETVYKCWDWLAEDVEYIQFPTTVTACVMLIIGTLLAGYGMRTFDKELPQEGILKYGRNSLLAVYLVGWALVSAFFLSTWLYKVAKETYLLTDKLLIFGAPAVVALVCIVAIAYAGNYQRHQRFGNKYTAFALIVISSAVAVATTFLLMAGVWKFYETLRESSPSAHIVYSSTEGWLSQLTRIIGIKTQAFTFGLPIVLEVMSLAVVIRMFIMGIFFSDERREWWGRTGAVLHRFIVIWIVMTISVFVLPKLVSRIGQAEIQSFVGLLGGWMALVGAGVRLAFSSTTSGENQDKSGLSVKEIFVRAVPYLFMIGFVLIGSATLNYFQRIVLWHAETRFGEFCLAILNTIILGLLTALLSWRAGVNEFTLHHFYRNRLIRAYLGATRRRTDRMQTANSFTGFDSKDDIPLEDFVKKEYYGPYPLINTALNATVISELDRQDRKAESFLFSPLFCGFDFSATRAAAYDKNGVSNYGYRPTSEFAGGPTLGTAMAISGAAVNPNMGYHSSTATAFMLSVFNVKLGWWIGNPRTKKWKNPEPFFGLAYLVSDLIGKSDISSEYVSLSDGGHFDNMGLYELVRRRCSLIILSDAEEDDKSLCEGLAMAVRRCRIDFGVEIAINTDSITGKDEKTRLCKSHIAEGTIKYPGNAKPGKLIYIKTAITGDESTDIREYKLQNPKFPQQPTSDQFFTEEQFESYRKLGYHSLM